jgi:hypothetical protein
MVVSIYDITIFCQQFGRNLLQQIRKTFLLKGTVFKTAMCLLKAPIHIFYRLSGAVFDLEIKFNLKEKKITSCTTGLCDRF